MGSWGGLSVSHLSNAALRCILPAVGLATTWLSISAHGENKVLNFDEGQLEQGLMPDGCNNPFRESIKFIDFFETAIVTMAAERGANGRGVENLFAVDHLRDLINEEANRKGGEESAIDRLIVTQLCHYEKIATQKNLAGGAKALQIFAKSPELHDHLAGISKKLLADGVSLYQSQQKALKAAKNQEDFVLSRQREIRKAKNMGEDKVRQLIEQ